jgi:hypothetical protein
VVSVQLHKSRDALSVFHIGEEWKAYAASCTIDTARCEIKANK